MKTKKIIEELFPTMQEIPFVKFKLPIQEMKEEQNKKTN